MGQEAFGHATLVTAEGKQESDGKALLETSELVFRGGFRIRVPFHDITGVSAEGGTLALAWPAGTARFDLGPHASKWAEKIRNPRGLLDKLGVKPGQRIGVLGVEDAGFLALLQTRIDRTTLGGTEGNDIVFYKANAPADLDRLLELRRSVRENGAIWVVSPKGKAAPIRDVDVIDAAKRAGLVDIKVVSFSQTQTALKLVVPVAARSRASG